MIYGQSLLKIVLLLALTTVNAFTTTSIPPSHSLRRQLLMSTTDEEVALVTVRFINTVSGKDIVTKVPEGSNLLVTGDAAGVKLPRACRTGLCGSCTCEVMDPMAIKTDSNPRDGFATIRACSVKCFVPDGMQEMVVDVYRMSGKGKGRLPVMPGKLAEGEEEEVVTTNPMARFSGNWEKEFRPNWETSDFTNQVGGAATAVGGGEGLKQCSMCRGMKRLECYNCNGAGKVKMFGGETIQCTICVGQRTVGCGYCRGSGLSLKKIKI